MIAELGALTLILLHCFCLPHLFRGSLTATFGNRIYENMANHVALLKLVLKNASTMNLPIAVGNGETVSIPKTGDHSPIGIWATVFITSSFGMYVSWNRKLLHTLSYKKGGMLNGD